MTDSTPPPVPSAVPAKTSGMAVTSLVLGILGLFTCGVTALFGLILGIISLVKIKENRDTMKGEGMALAGTIVSAVFLFIAPVFSILAAMLLPVLGAAKQRAQEINSVSNEKRLALAVRIYEGDHDNHLPPAATWCDAIKSIASTSDFVRPGANPGSQCGYAFNSALDNADASKVDPQTVMIFESDAGWNASGGPDSMRPSGYGSRAHAAVVAYADGSVQIIPASQIGRLRWNP